MPTTTHKTACILCNVNCGIEIEVNEAGHFERIVGDDAHPLSEGYMCQKASRLDYYQNHEDRLTEPLKRQADGSFAQVSWETAIQEIADKLTQLKQDHGGTSLGYVGGGGQGNHMGGIFGSTLRAAMGTRYFYSALAQEKTGNFWVNGKLFGRQNLHYEEAVAEAQYVLVIGANPMQSHGFAQARRVINAIRRDPARTLVVVDPRRTETAKKADFHLPVRPGKDAYLLSAMIATIIQEGLEDQAFLRERTVGFAAVKEAFSGIPVKEYAAIAGCEPAEVQQISRAFAQAKTATIRSDLGIEQSHNSTLNAYLSRLLLMLTGNFGKEGTANLHTALLPLIGHSKEPEAGGLTTQVTGMKEITKLFPPAILSKEIDTDHPKRLRGIVVDSSNPLITYPDTQALAAAFAKLELLVVIDVAMTETAQAAHYVLPAATQYEKWEATFFNLSFPKNAFHLRKPIFEPRGNSLPEPEIYRRLLVAMGKIPDRFPGLSFLAKADRFLPGLYRLALGATLQLNSKWKPYALHVLAQTIGKARPGAPEVAAPLWIAAERLLKKYPHAVRRAGYTGSDRKIAEALFHQFITQDTAVVFSVSTPEETWEQIKHPDKRIHLEIPELLQWLSSLESPKTDPDYPFNLMAGERRSYNANAIYRNPKWRKKDTEGAMKIHPTDAAALGVSTGDWVEVASRRATIEAQVLLTDEMLQGVVSLPHGHGMAYPDGAGRTVFGPRINLLTHMDEADPLAKTPYHKNVPVRLTAVKRLRSMST